MNVPAPSDFSPTNGLQGALHMARRGVRVFRIARGTKSRFIDKGWTATATTSPADIFDDWREGEFNVGLLMNGYVAVDVDVKGGKPGLASLAQIEPNLPRTYRQRTPSGGQHLIYKCPPGVEVANSVCRLGDGLDVRGLHGYVLGAGSEVGGGLYEVLDAAPIAEAPPWLIERLKVAYQRDPAAPKFVGEIDTPSATRAVVEFLKLADLAVEGDGGNACTYRIANACMDRGVSPETAAELMLENWNERCTPPWDDSDLRAIVDNAARYRQNPIGCYRPELGFEAVQIPESDITTILEKAAEVTRADILAASARDILKGMIAPGMSATLYGETGVGKSHIALDLAFHIARGIAYHGLKTRRVPVLYVQLEGVAGFRKRIVATREKFGDPGDYFARLKVPVSLAKDAAGLEGADLIIRSVRYLKAQTGADTALVIIDTKARATAGDNENDGADMSAFCEKRQGYIARETDSCVLTVHHAGKSGDYRGHTSQKAADDLVLRVERGKVTAEKVKDGKDGPLFNFNLELVNLGTDDDGAAVTTCVVEKCRPNPIEPERTASKRKEVVTFLAAFQLAASERQHPETGELIEAATADAVRQEFFASYPTGEANLKAAQATKRKAWGRAIRELLPPGFRFRTFEGVELFWCERAEF